MPVPEVGQAILYKTMYCNVPQTARHNLRRQKYNVPGRQHNISMHLNLAGRMVARQAKQFEKSGFLQITEMGQQTDS